MGPQNSVSMTAQVMLAQVRSPTQPNVRSPGPRGPMGGPMGMANPRMQQSPRQPQPMATQATDDMGSSQMMLGQGPGAQQGQGQGNGDLDNPQNTGMTPQDQLSKYV